jgi:asparagine synthase (glutamine-hydrolysing)
LSDETRTAASLSPSRLAGDGLITLSPIEAAVSTGIGEHVDEPVLPSVDPSLHPLRALEDAIRPLLKRAPCLVMFSGGRDSSSVLAVAAALARREGLPLPIPATQVFPEFPRTHETQWQELVIRHLELSDWQRFRYGTELSFLGSLARSVLLRHGLIAPIGAHALVPMLEAAGTGTVLTGTEGDGLFNGGTSAEPRDVLARRVAPTPRALLGVARAVSPAPLRRSWHLHRDPLEVSWLRPKPAQDLRTADADEVASEPLPWDRRVRWWARRRYLVNRCQAMEIVASDFDADLLHPLLDRRFLASLARWGGLLGRGGRAAVMGALFGHLLPAGVLERTNKADFTRAYWSGETREFAASWNGAGVPSALVDPEALRRTWLEPEPDARSGVLLHAAWMATSASAESKQPVNCRLE